MQGWMKPEILSSRFYDTVKNVTNVKISKKEIYFYNFFSRQQQVFDSTHLWYDAFDDCEEHFWSFEFVVYFSRYDDLKKRRIKITFGFSLNLVAIRQSEHFTNCYEFFDL